MANTPASFRYYLRKTCEHCLLGGQTSSVLLRANTPASFRHHVRKTRMCEHSSILKHATGGTHANTAYLRGQTLPHLPDTSGERTGERCLSGAPAHFGPRANDMCVSTANRGGEKHSSVSRMLSATQECGKLGAQLIGDALQLYSDIASTWDRFDLCPPRCFPMPVPDQRKGANTMALIIQKIYSSTDMAIVLCQGGIQRWQVRCRIPHQRS